MKHKFEQKVYYSDTDAYGVVWHGSYLRWLEMGRIEMCTLLGYNIVELQKNNINLPVINLNIRYKSSARVNDVMGIETEIAKFTTLSATFKQRIYNKTTGKSFVEAMVDVVAVDNSGKLYRRMPDFLYEVFKKAHGELSCV